MENCREDFLNLESGSWNPKSRKKKKYFNKIEGEKEYPEQRNLEELDGIILQFIFDRRKDDDPFKLNEIYSFTKKIKQLKRDGGKVEKGDLERAINKSTLPNELKTKPDYEIDSIFAESSFLHLVCKYYKLRRMARDGRLFIHPKYSYNKKRGWQNTGRFDGGGHLLTYCNHKPRQKRYQILHDLAGLFQLPAKELKKTGQHTK